MLLSTRRVVLFLASLAANRGGAVGDSLGDMILQLVVKKKIPIAGDFFLPCFTYPHVDEKTT